MKVKFNKKQIKALASIHAKAVSYFNEFQAKKPYLYREEERNNTVRCFEIGIINHIIVSGEFYFED